MASPLNISGTFPHLAVKADHVPRSETGIGALMPWADRLWFVTYVSHKSGTGGGTGLFSIDDDLKLTKHPQSVVGTYANRIIHHETHQLIIGPHIIDTKGTVRTFTDLVNLRLTATAEHLTDPANRVYFLGMEGELYEADVHTLKTTKLFDLRKELNLRDDVYPHFKDAYTAHGRLVVANNNYDNADFTRAQANGRLAEFDGTRWTTLETCQFNCVTGRTKIGEAMFATGADNASAILKVHLPATGWQTYRLPKATHTQDHAWTTEWPRMREIESERWLLNCSGMLYEVPAMQYADRVWGVRPVCTHLRIIADFCSWNGLLVLAGNQNTPIHDNNKFVGQPQAGLWFGITDDLWKWGKPAGWGGPWWESKVNAGAPSDPFLMTGFEHKCLHLTADRPATFTLEIDFMGTGTWCKYHTLRTDAAGYTHHVFPPGFSAHWIRLTPDTPCTATAQFAYT